MDKLSNLPRKPRGFAAIPPERAREIRRLGGLAAARDREHMRRIGSLGGRRRVEKARAKLP